MSRSTVVCGHAVSEAGGPGTRAGLCGFCGLCFGISECWRALIKRGEGVSQFG